MTTNEAQTATPEWVVSQLAARAVCADCTGPADAEVTYTADAGGQHHGQTVLQCLACWDRNAVQAAS